MSETEPTPVKNSLNIRHSIINIYMYIYTAKDVDKVYVKISYSQYSILEFN